MTSSNARLDGTAIRVLVVDDEPNLAELVSMALRMEGWEVRTAADGAGAIRVAAVYLWHCDGAGDYSMCSPAISGENYLRGVQEADQAGGLSFVSIFPGAYAGRWPHVHFEVYASLAEATAAGDPIKTSQLALPQEICEAVYATDGYGNSLGNLDRTSIETDMVLSDGYESQLATATGDMSAGYVASLAVPV